MQRTPSISIIILAAGESARMRLPKQLLPFKRTSLLQHAVNQAVASKADAIYLILGSTEERIRKSLRQSRAQVLTNENWRDGISSSIHAGIRALPDSADGAIISVCDQPFLSSRVFDNLIDTFASSDKLIIASEYNGAVGSPVLFSREYFEELRSLQGDRGARRIVLLHEEDVERIPFPDGSIDIDTPSDYQEFIRKELKIQ
jgi:molybdenum cofactor cytidylyltransferase